MAASTFQKVVRYFQKLCLPADQKMPLVLVGGEPPAFFYDFLPWTKRCEKVILDNKYQSTAAITIANLIVVTNVSGVEPVTKDGLGCGGLVLEIPRHELKYQTL